MSQKLPRIQDYYTGASMIVSVGMGMAEQMPVCNGQNADALCPVGMALGVAVMRLCL